MLVDAAIFGRVQRRRLYRAALTRDEDLSLNSRVLPESFSLTWADGRTVLSYRCKPVPKTVRLEGGFLWAGEEA